MLPLEDHRLDLPLTAAGRDGSKAALGIPLSLIPTVPWHHLDDRGWACVLLGTCLFSQRLYFMGHFTVESPVGVS